MPCSRPAGIRPSTGQTMSVRAGWPRRVARVLARVTRSRTSEFEGSTRNGGGDIGVGVGQRPHAAAPQLRHDARRRGARWWRRPGTAGCPEVVGDGVGDVPRARGWSSVSCPGRRCPGCRGPRRLRGCPRRCRSVSGWPRPPDVDGRSAGTDRSGADRVGSEHGRVDGEVDARAAGALEDAGHARVGPDGPLPGGLPGRVVAGEEVDVRVERQGQHRGHLERDVLLATVPGDEGPRPAGGLGRALLDHLDRDRHGREGVGGAQPPPRHRGRERSGLACRHGRRRPSCRRCGRRPCGAAGGPVVERAALVHRDVPAHDPQLGAGQRAGQRCRDGAGDRDVLARAHHGGRQGVEDDDGDVLDRRHGGTVLGRGGGRGGIRRRDAGGGRGAREGATDRQAQRPRVDAVAVRLRTRRVPRRPLVSGRRDPRRITPSPPAGSTPPARCGVRWGR